MRVILALIATLFCSSAQTQESFAAWMARFKQEALAQGISQQVLDVALAIDQPLPRVLELDRYQPEFIQNFGRYLQRRVTEDRVASGRALLEVHRELFERVEQRHGVPPSILAALWGMETNYGQTLGSFHIPEALATLAYEGRRGAFFRAQLLEALRIIDAGHVAPQAMTGSWAGAMGHLQFMPSTFRAYAIDGDGDGQINLWSSLADAMHSAGNYLEKIGWKRNMPVAIEVRLPAQFEWQQAQLQHRLPVSEWAAKGVLSSAGEALPEVDGLAAIVLPQGYSGPAFMVFDNFDAIMEWNRSLSYALTTAQLADRLDGSDELAGTLEETAVSREQMMALQQVLNDMGYDAGEVDGIAGSRTESAIRAYQRAQRLPADGYAAPNLIEHVVQHQRHAKAQLQGPDAMETMTVPFKVTP
jgi:membrane-bound lytic murein transglycosylase B